MTENYARLVLLGKERLARLLVRELRLEFAQHMPELRQQLLVQKLVRRPYNEIVSLTPLVYLPIEPVRRETGFPALSTGQDENKPSVRLPRSALPLMQVEDDTPCIPLVYDLSEGPDRCRCPFLLG